ncbi:MAG: adenosylmethionine--8-amino-7-oxononanoate transaminase [Pseudomonadota bacterium]
MTNKHESLLRFDRDHLWHPYSTVIEPPSTFLVESADACTLNLADGRSVIDGMASWWCAIHGYNHPVLNAAARDQIDKMSHVMFGGLTHEPAISLGQKLIAMTPAELEHIFFADSGSVSIEVALKMALQYWAARGEAERSRFLTIRGGYHGDTFGAMSVCDPVTGMHSLFNEILPQHLFAPRPNCRYGARWEDQDFCAFESLFIESHQQIAAVVLEPIVQGAGGMWFYHTEFLKRVRDLCDRYGVLLIADEIATGFGRTGRMFACEHAGIVPDILCLGKALTAGYLSMAATLATAPVAHTICGGEPGLFMHGPTFMANPLACAIAKASIELLENSEWESNIERIHAHLHAGLAPLAARSNVADVRTLGAIGVVEMSADVDLRQAPKQFVERGVWVRPFGRLVYLMPPFTITDDEITTLTNAIAEVIGLWEMN